MQVIIKRKIGLATLAVEAIRDCCDIAGQGVRKLEWNDLLRILRRDDYALNVLGDARERLNELRENALKRGDEEQFGEVNTVLSFL